MAIPRFTANVTLNSYKTKRTAVYSHRPKEPLNSTSTKVGKIVPSAPYWGDFRREGCISGKRKYSSILWGATGSWEKQCRETPAYITNADGVQGRYYAARCDNQGFNMWGIFHVPESSCGVPPPSRRCWCSDSQITTRGDCIESGESWCCQNGDFVTCSQA